MAVELLLLLLMSLSATHALGEPTCVGSDGNTFEPQPCLCTDSRNPMQWGQDRANGPPVCQASSGSYHNNDQHFMNSPNYDANGDGSLVHGEVTRCYIHDAHDGNTYARCLDWPNGQRRCDQTDGVTAFVSGDCECGQTRCYKARRDAPPVSRSLGVPRC